MASTSQTRIAAIAESTWGTTPSSPAFDVLRVTGESLNANIENVVSQEIRSDRNVSDLVQTGSTAGGSIDFELTYGTFDGFMESLFRNTWSTNVLKNGNTEKSFTIEKTFETGATDQYHRMTGAVVNSMSLSMEPGSIVTGSFDILGKELTSAQAAIASSTYTAANANPVINAATNFASLAITGATSPELMSLDINITNSLAHQRKLGSLSAKGIVPRDRFEVTGSLTAYFENEELFELFLAGTSADLTFKLGGASSANYVFVIGTLKFENATVVAGGNDQDLVVQMDYRGLYDSSDAATLKITRTAA